MNVKVLVACVFAVSFFAAAQVGAASALASAKAPVTRLPAQPGASPKAALVGKASPQPSPSHQKAARPARAFLVAIDAGHGGKDTGAVGHNGTQEKQVTYAIARKLERLVRAKPGMRPLMVRKSDTYIGLRQRTEIARLAAADLFISVHADAYSDAHVQGSAVYVLSPKRTEYTAFAQSARESRRAAARVLGELSRQQDVHHRFVQKARYAVLESPKLPALLVETGFLSNPDEERRLSSPAHQEKIARCIFNGVRAYFQSVRPAQGIGVKDKPVLLASRQ